MCDARAAPKLSGQDSGHVSPAFGMQLSACLALYSFLFCGLLVNKAALQQMGQHLRANTCRGG
jgi:hypothetical protein